MTGDPTTLPPVADITGLLVKIAGGGGSAMLGYKFLTFLAKKLDLNIQADQANAAMRVEMQTTVTTLREILANADTALREARTLEAKYLKQIAKMEAEIEVLRGEVERLRKLLVHSTTPGLEGTLEFKARTGAEPPEGGE